MGKKKSSLMYIMNPRCGWCTKANPVVEELIKDGHKIKTLDVSNPKDAETANKVKGEFSVQCGTPLFIDAESGNSVCGFREKDVLEKWANGEEIPAPPRPKAPTGQQPPQQPTMRTAKLEYIWLDGHGTKNIRTKTKYMPLRLGNAENPMSQEQIFLQIPEWAFDGSSTKQADTENSDCVLKPVRLLANPLSQDQNFVSYIVMCEVYNSDGTPHETNSRYKLREFVDNFSPQDWSKIGLVVAVEQEYLIMDPRTNWPSTWDYDYDTEKGKKPKEPQGRYYCGVGSDLVEHRTIADAHASTCAKMGINIVGTNAEVMKSQWEYQLGPAHPVTAADQLWLSRYILHKLGESNGFYINLEPKPISGQWNGSGAHINFSTKTLREEGGRDYIDSMCEALKDSHKEHMKVYGENNKKRLSGKYETAHHDDFTWGERDRTVSIRIPHTTSKDGVGYLEDRRPGANMDPYEAYLALSKTVSDFELSSDKKVDEEELQLNS